MKTMDEVTRKSVETELQKSFSFIAQLGAYSSNLAINYFVESVNRLAMFIETENIKSFAADKVVMFMTVIPFNQIAIQIFALEPNARCQDREKRATNYFHFYKVITSICLASFIIPVLISCWKNTTFSIH